MWKNGIQCLHMSKIHLGVGLTQKLTWYYHNNTGPLSKTEKLSGISF